MATILVVDDRPINREFLVTLLGYIGHLTLQAADGAEALALAVERLPDLVITDVLMPVMDGIEFVRRLHADPRVAHIPVIFYTATYRLGEARPLAQSCGVDTVIGKPASPQVILDAVAAKLGAGVPRRPAPLPEEGPAAVGLPHLQQRLNELHEQGPAPGASAPASLGTATTLGLRLAAVLELGLELGPERDIVKLLGSFVRAAGDIMNARFTAAGLLEGGAEDCSVVLEGVPAGLAPQLASARFGDGLAALLAEERVLRLTEAAAMAVLPPGHPAVRDLLVLPIRSQTRRLGWLYFADKLGLAAFADEDLQIATVLATKLSLACDNLRLFDEALSYARELETEVVARRDSEARFRLAVDAVGLGIWIWNLRTNRLSWDERVFALFGCPSVPGNPEIPYDYWKSRVHPDDIGPLEARLGRLVAGEAPCDASFRILREDGELRWLKMAAIVERDPAGEPLRVVGTNLDITEESLAKNRIVELNATLEAQVSERSADLNAAIQSLHEQEEFIRTVTDALPIMIGYWDADLRLRFANAAYRVWTGKGEADILGLEMQALIDASHLADVEPHVRAALEGKKQSFERTLVKGDGSTLHTLATYIPDFLDRQVRGFYVMVADVTQLKVAELRLAELNVELERRATAAEGATRAKGEFLANMSHEIRTPMNGILGLCYLMEKQELPAASREMLRRINGAGRALLGIINDILDFSKIEACQLVVEQVPFRLSDVLDNLATIMAAALGSKPVQLLVGPAPVGADFLTGDPLRLGQVLINLVGNAIKFTDQGEVVVRVESLEASPGPRRAARLRFSVRDTGIGIPEDKQEAIFHAFSQADASTTRSFGGTGLGLTISSRLVELMGGTLGVNSKPGRGSEFSFELVFALSDPGDSVMPEMTHQRVLIADDQDTARAVLAETAASLGWHAETVPSGEKAIERIRSAAEEAYDILLLDWRMPGLDGLQAAVQLRSRSGRQKDPIIVMVTAYDQQQLLQECGSEVVDVILTKPVTSSSLYYAVLEAKNRRGQLVRAPAPLPASRQLEGVTVLVVDDSDLNRDVAASILRGEGATVELAEDGSVALDVLTDQPRVFDVVLMDIQMPVMDGYAATRLIRATPALAHLPVVALSAGAFSEQRELALAAGVNEFVAKPFDVEQLVATVLRLSRPATAPRRLEAGPAGGQVPVILARHPASLDLARGALIWKDAAVHRHWLRKFIRDNAEVVAQIAAADGEEGRRLAHKLKGAAGNLGLPEVAAAAGELERPTLQGAELAGVLARLQEALLVARAAIATLAPEPDADDVANAAPPLADPGALRPLVEKTLHALGEANPDAAEPFLVALTPSLRREQLAPVRDALDNFNFRVASDTLRQLAVKLGIFPEI